MTKIKSFFVFALALVALVACKESNADYRHAAEEHHPQGLRGQ